MEIKVTKLTDSTGDLHSAYRTAAPETWMQLFLVRCCGISRHTISLLRDRTKLNPIAVEYGRYDTPERLLGELSIFVETLYLESGDKQKKSCIRAAEVIRSLRDRVDSENCSFIISAAGLMDVCHDLCPETTGEEVAKTIRKIIECIKIVDPALWPHLRRPCVLTGVCRESKRCGYMATDAYAFDRKTYKELFKPKV